MMDVTAPGDGRFYVAMMPLGGFQYDWNKDGTLGVWSTDKEPRPINVRTNRGVFVEAVDEAGAIIASGGDGNWLWVPLSKKPVRLRYKTLPPAALTRAQLNKARRTVTRYVLDGSPYSDGVKLPDTLTGLIKWTERLLAGIPAKSRAKASFTFDTSSSYGESYAHVEVSYSEPETDAEVIARLQVEAERARIQEASERAELTRLQSKLGTRGIRVETTNDANAETRVTD
jgi:hypothetical protein